MDLTLTWVSKEESLVNEVHPESFNSKSMLSKVGIYESHEQALAAVSRLSQAHYPIDHVSIIGEAQIINDHLYLKSFDPLTNMPIALGAATGIISGILAGIGILTIPGFGFLYGVGAIVGAFGGFDLGLLGGGLAAVLIHFGVHKDDVIKYEEHIKAGRFLVMARGTQNEVLLAERILQRKDSLHLMN